MKLYQLLSKYTANDTTGPVCIIDGNVAREFPDAERIVKVLSNRDGDPMSARNVESFAVRYGSLEIKLKKERPA